MNSGPPPLSPAFDPEIEAARGTVRDALGGLSNLRQLLRSVRVGPKALSAVIPDVHASCVPLAQAVRRLLIGLPAFVAEGSGEELEQFVLPRIERLETILGNRRRGGLKASQRLALERAVTAIASDLGMALNLLDTLFEAQGGGRVAVDAVELLHECAHVGDASTPGARTVTLIFERPTVPATVEVNARAAIALITSAIAATADAAEGDQVLVELSAESSGVCRFRFLRAVARPPAAQTLAIGAPPPSRLLSTGSRSLAGALGGTYVESDVETVVTLPGPAGP